MIDENQKIVEHSFVVCIATSHLHNDLNMYVCSYTMCTNAHIATSYICTIQPHSNKYVQSDFRYTSIII